ncbi:MAG TPA: hypothetical protein HPQ04_06085 [Rhodospirillaceae bacterium]|nr:hypothetical protein [Rhodospirillaceae bacterium]
MPLDDLQKAVLAVLCRNRTPSSFFAGGSVLNRHGFRLSDDQDIFHGENVDVVDTAERDRKLLLDAGYSVELSKQFEGFIEMYVGTAELGRTKVQWVEAGSWCFFAPVPDPDFGYRLHIVDLAVNKVLAAGGRREVRDLIDLALIHRYVMPLWQALWAAPGKDEKWSPLSLVEQISKRSNLRQEDIDDVIASLVQLSAPEIGRIIFQALEEARDVFAKLPDDTAGTLSLDVDGRLISPLAADDKGHARIIRPRRGGSWPSGPNIDHMLIEGLIDRFGHDGAKLLADDTIAAFADGQTAAKDSSRKRI